MSKTSQDTSGVNCRLNKVGGQAVIEGVMMKAGNRTVTSCRKPDGSIVVTDDSFHSIRKKHKILNLPIIRGFVNFIEMMALSVKTLEASANAMGLEEEETRFEKWLKKHLGLNATKIIMFLGVLFGLALSVTLFIFLPTLIAQGVDFLLGGKLGAFSAVVEGVSKIGIFLLYLWLISFMSDIRRTFMYHGAEHKSIACFESGEELTPENAMKHTRFHPRCGTSFMFFMILLGILAGLFIHIIFPEMKSIYYVLIRLLILPLLMGLGYEYIMFAGKHDNAITRAISAPGLWVPRLTTKEPTLDMLEIAITSIKCALRDDSPEFAEFYETRAWEKRAEDSAPSDTEAEESTVTEAEASSVTEDNVTPACESDTDPASANGSKTVDSPIDSPEGTSDYASV